MKLLKSASIALNWFLNEMMAWSDFFIAAGWLWVLTTTTLPVVTFSPGKAPLLR